MNDANQNAVAGCTPRAPRVLFVTGWGDRPEVATAIGLARRGCDIRVCLMPGGSNEGRFAQAGLDVISIPMRRRIDPASIRLLREELRRGRYDILHLLHNRAISNGLIAARGIPGLKVIAYRGIVGNLSYLDPASWLRHLNPRVDRIICVADAVRDSMLKVSLFGLKLRPERVVTIHKGHDPAWYDATPVDLAQFGIPADAFVIGCIANWCPRKGLEILLEAFASLPPDRPVYLLLAGHMKSRRLAARVARHVYADRIRNLGYRDDAPGLIAACDVSVLPTVKREGLPKTVIEAMAYGVTPVVTDCGGSPELVVDGQCGRVVPPGDAPALADALLTLYHDEPLRRRLGQAARERIARDFNVRTTIDRTLAVYQELLAERS